MSNEELHLVVDPLLTSQPGLDVLRASTDEQRPNRSPDPFAVSPSPPSTAKTHSISSLEQLYGSLNVFGCTHSCDPFQDETDLEVILVFTDDLRRFATARAARLLANRSR